MQTISRILALTLIVLFATVMLQQESRAQTFRIVTINTFTGAVTGGALGGATIALQNNSDIDYYPLRFGVGMGTIMGLGTGFYDVSHSTGDSGIYVSGLINSANSTGTIILLDTFYGAATGTIVGTAISLMTNSRLVKGVQYGSGAGAWVGFAFGLVDAFTLSTSESYDNFYEDYTSNHSGGNNGLLEIRGQNDTYSVGFLNPVLFNTINNSGKAGMTSRTHLGIELTRVNIAL